MRDPRRDQPLGGIGRRWTRFTAGDSFAGDPLAEWAYISQRFPEGIRQSALRRAAPDIQRETAATWFSLNLEPYDLGKWPLFAFDAEPAQDATFGSAVFGDRFAGSAESTGAASLPDDHSPQLGGWDEGRWVPPPIESYIVLIGEFGDSLPESVIGDVIARFPGEWMWRQPFVPPAIDLADGRPEWAMLSANIVAYLDAISQIIEEQQPAPGEIGHNRPDCDWLSVEDEQRLRAAIARTRVAVMSRSATSAAEIRAGESTFEEIGGTLGQWALRHADAFTTEYAKTLGREAAKWTVRVLSLSALIQALLPALKLAAQVIGVP